MLLHFCSHWLDGAPARDEPDYTLGGPLHGGLAEYMIFDRLGSAEVLTLREIETGELRVRVEAIGEVTTDPERLCRGVAFVNAGLSSGSFSPVIDRTFDLVDISDRCRGSCCPNA